MSRQIRLILDGSLRRADGLLSEIKPLCPNRIIWMSIAGKVRKKIVGLPKELRLLPDRRLPDR